MKRLLQRLFGKQVNQTKLVPSPTPGESPLKLAFRDAREAQDIDLVLPVFWVTQLYVVAGSTGPAGELNDLFIVPSRGKNGRMCVTVSEQEEWLDKINWPKRFTNGAQLLVALPPLWEIMIIDEDGGDFISREHRERFQEILPQS